MTLFGSLFNSLEDPEVPISSANVVELFGGELKNDAGVDVNEKKALGIMAVWCAVTLISGTIASLPLHAYKAGDSGERVRLPGTSAAAKLLASPHPDLTPFELWETVLSHMLLWGNAFLWKAPFEGQKGIAGLHLIHPSRVKVGRVKSGKLAGRKIFALDGSEPFTEDEILHIPGFGYDGTCGVSPIRAARQGLGLALAAEKFGAKLFGSGSLATGVLQTDARLTEPQADALAKRWREKRAGLESAHSTLILDSGAKFQQLTIPPEDAQFLESRRFQISEIARLFRVPPHMLMDTDKSTSWGSGIEQQSIGFVVFTLRPWLTRIEQRVTRIIAPEKAYARFSIEGLLRGDAAARKEFYTGLWNLGALSTNEIRGLEDMAPVEGGDVRYRPLNMGELGTTDSTPTGVPDAS